MSADSQRQRRIASFLTLASEELAAAGTLLDKLPRQGAYFQQQAVEKLLRAVLEVEAIPAGPSHNIRALADLLPKDHVLKARFVGFEDLSSAATRFRYPTASGAIASVSAVDAIRRQEEIVKLKSEVVAFAGGRRGQ